MQPILIAWLLAAFLSITALAKLARGRQAKLVTALHGYVEEQLEWSRKRAKASRLARKLAQEKAEDEAEQTRLTENPNADPRFDKYDHQKAA